MIFAPRRLINAKALSPLSFDRKPFEVTGNSGRIISVPST